MSPERETFLAGADTVVALLRHPAVWASWEKPSALPEFGISGLAGHLARQVLSVPELTRQVAPDQEPISLMDHYARSTWIGATVDSEISLSVRNRGEELATDGPEALAQRVAAAVTELPDLLAEQPDGRVVYLNWASWALTLDDFLTTRLMEIAVHTDDLAVSVDIECPPLPTSVFDGAVDLLTRLAVRRHGQSAVLRALSRSERAPASIAAI